MRLPDGSAAAVAVVGVGAGGHCRVLLDIVRQLGGYEIAGLVDANPDLAGTYVGGTPVLGTDRVLQSLFPGIRHAFLGVGSVRSTMLRQKLFEEIGEWGFEWIRAVHPRATVAADVRLGAGAAIMAGAVLNPGVVAGVNVIVNTGAVVDHDCSLGDHVHIAPGATLSGGVRVGDRSHIGTAAAVVQGVSIGADSTVAAGAVVIRDVPAGVVVAGVPARIISGGA